MPALPPVLCARPGDLRPGAPRIPGTRSGQCVRCGCAVLLAPSTAAMVARGECTPFCIDCLRIDTESVLAITPEQLADTVRLAKLDRLDPDRN